MPTRCGWFRTRRCLANLDGRTALTGAPPPWHAMIYFDGTRVFGTVSYYLWKLFGANRPDEMVEVRTEYPTAKPPVIAGQIGVGTWDATAEFKDIRVEQNGKTVWDGKALRRRARLGPRRRRVDGRRRSVPPESTRLSG